MNKFRIYGITELNFLTVRVLMKGKGRFKFVGSRMVLQLKKRSKRFEMRKIEVGERLLLMRDALNVVSMDIMLLSAKVQL